MSDFVFRSLFAFFSLTHHNFGNKFPFSATELAKWTFLDLLIIFTWEYDAAQFMYACLSLNCELKTETMCFLHCIVCDDNAVWSLRQVGAFLRFECFHLTHDYIAHKACDGAYSIHLQDEWYTNDNITICLSISIHINWTELNTWYWILNTTLNRVSEHVQFRTKFHCTFFIIVIIRSKQIVANIHIHRKQLFFCARNRKTHEQISNLSSIIDLLWKLDNEENTTKKNIDTR